MLEDLKIEPSLDELVRGELVDQVEFTPRAGFAFRHPLIRAVAYESQLTIDAVPTSSASRGHHRPT